MWSSASVPKSSRLILPTPASKKSVDQRCTSTATVHQCRPYLCPYLAHIRIAQFPTSFVPKKRGYWGTADTFDRTGIVPQPFGPPPTDSIFEALRRAPHALRFIETNLFFSSNSLASLRPIDCKLHPIFPIGR